MTYQEHKKEIMDRFEREYRVYILQEYPNENGLYKSLIDSLSRSLDEIAHKSVEAVEPIFEKSAKAPASANKHFFEFLKKKQEWFKEDK